MSNVYRKKYDQRPIWATYFFNSLLIREGDGKKACVQTHVTIKNVLARKMETGKQ